MRHTIEFCIKTDCAAGGGTIRVGERKVESSWEKHPALEASGATYKKRSLQLGRSVKEKEDISSGCLSPRRISESINPRAGAGSPADRKAPQSAIGPMAKGGTGNVRASAEGKR